jgi:hypothetical protein
MSLLGIDAVVAGYLRLRFIIELASQFPMLKISARSCVRRPFSLASVASDGLDDAAAIDEGGGGVNSLWDGGEGSAGERGSTSGGSRRCVWWRRW